MQKIKERMQFKRQNNNIISVCEIFNESVKLAVALAIFYLDNCL